MRRWINDGLTGTCPSITEHDRFQYEHILALIVREAKARQRSPLSIICAIIEEIAKYGTDGYE